MAINKNCSCSSIDNFKPPSQPIIKYKQSSSGVGKLRLSILSYGSLGPYTKISILLPIKKNISYISLYI